MGGFRADSKPGKCSDYESDNAVYGENEWDFSPSALHPLHKSVKKILYKIHKKTNVMIWSVAHILNFRLFCYMEKMFF